MAFSAACTLVTMLITVLVTVAEGVTTAQQVKDHPEVLTRHRRWGMGRQVAGKISALIVS